LRFGPRQTGQVRTAACPARTPAEADRPDEDRRGDDSYAICAKI